MGVAGVLLPKAAGDPSRCQGRGPSRGPPSTTRLVGLPPEVLGQPALTSSLTHQVGCGARRNATGWAAGVGYSPCSALL